MPLGMEAGPLRKLPTMDGSLQTERNYDVLTVWGALLPVTLFVSLYHFRNLWDMFRI